MRLEEVSISLACTTYIPCIKKDANKKNTTNTLVALLYTKRYSFVGGLLGKLLEKARTTRDARSETIACFLGCVLLLLICYSHS